MAGHDGWLTLAEVSQRLGVSINAVRRLIDRGQLACRIERRSRVRQVHAVILAAYVERSRLRPGDLAHLNQYARHEAKAEPR